MIPKFQNLYPGTWVPGYPGYGHGTGPGSPGYTGTGTRVPAGGPVCMCQWAVTAVEPEEKSLFEQNSAASH
eukprot:2302242-Rhodomonas_salina.1